MKLNCCFSYFGAKKDALKVLHPRLLPGAKTIVDPFCGRLDWIVYMPEEHRRFARHITVGDVSGNLVNFWQAVQHDPAGLAGLIDKDIQAEILAVRRNNWLIDERLNTEAMLSARPDAYDLQKAHWWLSCQCMFKEGACKSKRKTTCISWSNDLYAVHDKDAYFKELSRRLQGVEILYRDWLGTLSAAPYVRPVAILLDPPYNTSLRTKVSYEFDDGEVAREAAEWAVDHGGQKDVRIALCGMSDEHRMPADWTFETWKSAKCRRGAREGIWFSPNCIHVEPTKRGKRTKQRM